MAQVLKPTQEIQNWKKRSEKYEHIIHWKTVPVHPSATLRSYRGVNRTAFFSWIRGNFSKHSIVLQLPVGYLPRKRRMICLTEGGLFKIRPRFFSQQKFDERASSSSQRKELKRLVDCVGTWGRTWRHDFAAGSIYKKIGKK